MEAISVKNFGYVHLISYVDLDFNDQIYLLKMRNDLAVRKWMFSQRIITEIEHFDFIDKLSVKKDAYYFLVKTDDIIIGCINFSDIAYGASVKFGIFTNPFEKIMGAGKVLEAAGLNYAQKMWDVKKILLEVYSNNLRAINFYKKSGYRIIGIYKKKCQEVVQMEKIRKHDTNE